MKVAKICDDLSHVITFSAVSAWVRLFPYKCDDTDDYARYMAVVLIGLVSPVVIPLYLISSYLERSRE